jgi:hypothetical protein
MKDLTIKGLTIMSFIIGVAVTPIQAQAQQSLPGAPASFNNLVWDPPTPPTEPYAAAPAAKASSKAHRVGGRYSRSAR